MKKRTGIVSLLMAAMLIVSSFTVYADEEVDTVDAVESEQTDDASLDGEVGEVSEEAVEESAIVMSSITASNGLTIAEKIPESIIPEGFHKTTVQYSGTNVEVAYMDSDFYGEVVLAYLASADGSNGDFYLCDINTAEMSDFVKITNGEGKFIVVLNPGDTVVAPSGFIKATLDWHGKRVTAWALPKENSEEAEEAKAFESLELYALDISAGANSDDEEIESSEDAEKEDEEEVEEETKKSKKKDKKKETEVEPEDGSRVEYAPSSDFFLIYAIDQNGKVGFYLYDIAGETFQRYVEIANGDMKLLSQYRKDAKVRLIIIVVLAVLLVISIIVIINLAMNSGSDRSSRRRSYDDEDDDEDDEIEQMRRRVAKKEKRHIKQGRRELNYLMDIDDEDDEDEDDDEEDDEDEEDYIPRRKRRSAPVSRREKSKPRRRPIYEDEEDDEEDEDEVYEAPVRRKSSVTAPSYEDANITRPSKPSHRGGISIEPEDDLDLDDDFEFEFLDLK